MMFLRYAVAISILAAIAYYVGAFDGTERPPQRYQFSNI